MIEGSNEEALGLLAASLAGGDVAELRPVGVLLQQALVSCQGSGINPGAVLQGACALYAEMHGYDPAMFAASGSVAQAFAAELVHDLGFRRIARASDDDA